MSTGECKISDDDPTKYERSYCTSVAPTSMATYLDGSLAASFAGIATPSSPATTPVTPVTPNLSYFYASNDDDDVCFTSESTVELESGEDIPLSDLKIGSKILTMDKHGSLSYSDVIAIPHQGGDKQMESFHTVSAGGIVAMEATAEHLVAVVDSHSKNCHELDSADFKNMHSLVSMSSLETGMCVAVVRNNQVKVMPISRVEVSKRLTSLTSVVTQNSGYPVVSGVVASSFALNDFFPHLFYNVHRVLYSLGMHSVTSTQPFVRLTSMLGKLAVQVHRAVM